MTEIDRLIVCRHFQNNTSKGTKHSSRWKTYLLITLVHLSLLFSLFCKENQESEFLNFYSPLVFYGHVSQKALHKNQHITGLLEIQPHASINISSVITQVRSRNLGFPSSLRPRQIMSLREVCMISLAHLFCDPMDCSPPRSCPWDSLGKDTGVGCHFLLQGIFLTQTQTHVSCVSYIGRRILHH